MRWIIKIVSKNSQGKKLKGNSLALKVRKNLVMKMCSTSDSEVEKSTPGRSKSPYWRNVKATAETEPKSICWMFLEDSGEEMMKRIQGTECLVSSSTANEECSESFTLIWPWSQFGNRRNGSRRLAGCSKHMTGQPKALSTYKKYNGIGYSQNSKAYIILNKHTRKIEESLNVTFDETPPPSKTSPLVDDDLDEEEAIREIEKKNLENVVEDETLEIDEIVNIKESRNHPLENVIGNLNQRTLRSQAQNQSNFYCFISTIEPKNVNEALGDESWIVAMQEELIQFMLDDVWDFVLQLRNYEIYRKLLGV
ncbi:hypothetical protein Tco_0529949 [Tanacetum coccineum]